MLAHLAIGWLAGILAGCLSPHPLGPYPAIAALMLGVALALSGDVLRASGWHHVLGLGALAAGLSVGPAPPPPAVPEGLARVTAEVEAVAHGPDGARTTLRVEEGRRLEDGRPVPLGARLRLNGASAPPGARVSFLGRLHPRRPFRNLTPHPRWPLPRPIAATARLPAGAALERVSLSAPRALVAHARARVREALERTLPSRSRGLARALVLGEGLAVEGEARRAIAGAGLSHLLAVSGLHVTIVAGLLVALLARLLGRLRLTAHPRRAAQLAGVPLALLFAVFAGGAPSAERAAATVSVSWLLAATGRRPRPTAVAAAACLLLTLSAPRDALAPSFLLSVLATASLVTARPAPARDALSPLRDALRVSARATLATAPLVVWLFGSVPPVGLLANVLLLPLGAAVLVPGAVLHALLATLLPAASGPTAALFDRAATAFVVACDGLAGLPFGAALPPPSTAQGLLLAGLCLALLALPRASQRALAVALACLGLVLSEGALRRREQPRDRVRVSVLDVGQGDATLVDLPDGRLMVIDGGGGLPDPGAAEITPLLAARRRTHIDVLVMSHPHPDHYGGLLALAERFTIGEVWDSGQAEAEADLVAERGEPARWLAALRARGIRVRTAEELCRVGQRFGAARLDVLWPCPAFDSGHDANDNSLVLRLQYGRHRFLFAGDVEAHAEGALAAGSRALFADVLKVGHHGSRTSSTPAFLERVRPRWSVVSCGVANRYGHPHPEALARLHAVGTEVLRTDLEGGVTVVSDGVSLRAETWSGRREALSSRVAPSPGRPPAP